jgi:hypothetical protein
VVVSLDKPLRTTLMIAGQLLEPTGEVVECIRLTVFSEEKESALAIEPDGSWFDLEPGRRYLLEMTKGETRDEVEVSVETYGLCVWPPGRSWRFRDDHGHQLY